MSSHVSEDRAQSVDGVLPFSTSLVVVSSLLCAIVGSRVYMPCSELGSRGAPRGVTGVRFLKRHV